MSKDTCCSSNKVAVPSVYQTLDELEFERGIWSFALNEEIEKLLKALDKGTEPSVRDSSGYTALHYAARNGKESACSILLRRGADVNAQTPGGATPLLRAASQGHTSIVQLLLKYHADPLIYDSDKKTPLHKAAEGKHIEVAKILVEHKPELKNMRDTKGLLPLDYADPNCVEIISILSISS